MGILTLRLLDELPAALDLSRLSMLGTSGVAAVRRPPGHRPWRTSRSGSAPSIPSLASSTPDWVRASRPRAILWLCWGLLDFAPVTSSVSRMSEKGRRTKKKKEDPKPFRGFPGSKAVSICGERRVWSKPWVGTAPGKTQDQSIQDQSIQDQSIQDQSIQDQSVHDQSIIGASQDDQGSQPTPSTTAGDQLSADDLLHAAYVLPPEMIANVELTLDHLSDTVDLFDVPPFDYGDTG